MAGNRKPASSITIDMTAPLRDLDGHPILDGNAVGNPPMTLGRVAANSLITVFADDGAIDGVTKVKWFALAMRCVDPGPADLAAEDIAVLKERIGKAYGPLIVGRAFALLGAGSAKDA